MAHNSAMATLFAMALSWLYMGLNAQEPATTVAKVPVTAVDSIATDSVVTREMPASRPVTVSLITCYPGREIYELYGHEAIRVRGEGIDSIWNFGVFDFRQPNFVYRFVKGETDYMCAGYPFAWFMPEYVERGSKVVEQDLNLSQEEAQTLLHKLQINALPENRVYRYNYVKDNCATRIWQLAEAASGGGVVYPDSVHYGTFRKEMEYYNRNYPWYQLGIDIALGSGLDYSLSSKEEMFVPVEMERMMNGALKSDGTSLVSATRVLNEGRGDVTLPPTPWWAGPLLWCWVAGVLLSLVALFGLMRRRAVRWVYSVWFSLLGIAGCVVAFLVFVSSHEATAPNVLILWLNPIQLLPAIFIWPRRAMILEAILFWLEMAALIGMTVWWIILGQSVNAALYPLIGATFVMALTYAIIAHKDSYNRRRSSRSAYSIRTKRVIKNR